MTRWDRLARIKVLEVRAARLDQAVAELEDLVRRKRTGPRDLGLAPDVVALVGGALAILRQARKDQNRELSRLEMAPGR